jgi:hypothetical protein
MYTSNENNYKIDFRYILSAEININLKSIES